MRCVRVNIKKIEVTRFSVREGVDLNVFFDDGAKKCLQYSTMLDNAADDAKNIITKIQVYEKAQNRVLDADDVLDSFVSVVIENDEEMLEKIKTFLSRIKDDRTRLKGYGSHTGYIETLNKMQKKSVEFKPGNVHNEV
jgi:hypothetical protein